MVRLCASDGSLLKWRAEPGTLTFKVDEVICPYIVTKEDMPLIGSQQLRFHAGCSDGWLFYVSEAIPEEYRTLLLRFEKKKQTCDSWLSLLDLEILEILPGKLRPYLAFRRHTFLGQIALYGGSCLPEFRDMQAKSRACLVWLQMYDPDFDMYSQPVALSRG